jgi:hypothetical protein
MADLEQFVRLFAQGVAQVDGRAPVARSCRNGSSYRPGIGPFGEDATVTMVMSEVGAQFTHSYHRGVPYPLDPRKRCDLVIGDDPDWELALEL